MVWLNRGKTKRFLILAIMIIALAYFLYLVRGLFFSFALAVFIAYLINPLVGAVERKGASRTWAILVAYLALLIVLSGIFLYGAPRVIEQLNGLSETIPLYTEQAHGIIQSIQARYSDMGIPDGMRQVIDERIHWLEENILQLIRDALAAVVGSVGYVFKILLAPVLSFYFLKDLELIKKKVLGVLPDEWREGIKGLLKEIDQALGSFVRGYLLIAAIVGGVTALSMALLGVDFALMLGLFAGFAELIPYFGPVIGAVPAVGLAVLKSRWLAVEVAIAFFIIHQLEGNIISPRILGDRVGLHPLVIIFSLLAGGEIYGLAGMLLAVPAAAVLRVIVIFVFFTVLDTK